MKIKLLIFVFLLITTFCKSQEGIIFMQENLITGSNPDTIPIIDKFNYWYVDATNGNDDKNGHSPAQAFKTIAKLQNYLNKDSISPGHTISLKRGEKWRESLYINNVNGTSNKKIILTAYGTGAKPELSGYKVLGAFIENNGIWSITDKDLPLYYWSVCAFNNPPYGKYSTTYNWLLVNDVPYSISRYPDNGYLKMTNFDTVGIKLNKPTRWVEDNVNIFANGYWNGAQISYVDYPWFFNRAKVTYSSNRYTFMPEFTTQGLDAMHYGNLSTGTYPKYFLTNHINAMKKNGSWAYDNSNTTLKVKWGTGFNSTIKEFVDRDTLINLESCNYWVINNIKFTGGFQSAIKLLRCQNILIDSCEFKYTPIWGILGIENLNTTINKCTFDKTIGTCISYIHCNGELIQDCRAVSVGVTDAMNTDRIDGGAVFYHTSTPEGTIDILRNYVDSTSYCGTIINNDTRYGATPGTELVEGNLIMNTGQVLSDGAAIYFFDANDVDGFNKIIKNNILMYGNGNPTLHPYNASEAHGIYFDGWTSDCIATNNFMTGFRNAAYLNGTKYNTIRSNTFYNNTLNIGSYSGAWYGAETGHAYATSYCRYTNNKVVLRDSTKEFGIAWLSPTMTFNAPYLNNYVDSNSYYNPFNEDGYCLGTIQNWGIITRRNIPWFQSNFGWETHSKFNTPDYTYQDKIGNVGRDKFVTVLKNWSPLPHLFNLGNCSFKDLTGKIVSGTVLVGAYDTYVLFYVNGDLSTMDNDLYLESKP
jgi:hypothetical protein